MAYLKYKELTKYFYFYKELDKEDLPKYVSDYIFKSENILKVYATKRDKGVFTNKKILLFDVKPLSSEKLIHVIPYNSISTISISFTPRGATIYMYVDSGYPITLKFVNLKSEDKVELRLLFQELSLKIVK